MQRGYLGQLRHREYQGYPRASAPSVTEPTIPAEIRGSVAGPPKSGCPWSEGQGRWDGRNGGVWAEARGRTGPLLGRAGGPGYLGTCGGGSGAGLTEFRWACSRTGACGKGRTVPTEAAASDFRGSPLLSRCRQALRARVACFAAGFFASAVLAVLAVADLAAWPALVLAVAVFLTGADFAATVFFVVTFRTG